MKHSALLASLLALGIAFGGSGCSSQQVVNSAMVVEHGIAGLREKTVQVADHTIYYMEAGRSDAPTIVMLHGFGGDRDNWTRMAKFLSHDFHLIIPDLPGFGKSTFDRTQSYGLDAQLTRLEGFTSALGLQRFHLVGNSMGGYLATGYAAAHPQQVQSLGLFAAAGVDMPVQSPMFQQLQSGKNPLLVESVDDFNRFLKLVFVDEPFMPQAVREFFAEKFASQREANKKVFDEMYSKRVLLNDRFAKVKMPTLILWGDQDHVLDKSSIEVFKTGIPQAEVVMLENCGHVPMLEQPYATAKAYRQFLDSKAS